MHSGIFLPFPALPGFTPMFQAELAEYIQSQIGVTIGAGGEVGRIASADDEEPADLSAAQAKKFLDRVSDKVRTTLRVIAEADATGFTLAAVIKALHEDQEADLRGVWGGITKRTRTVLGDDEAYLIWWNEQDHGWVGRVSPTTHNSFRKVLSI